MEIFPHAAWVIGIGHDRVKVGYNVRMKLLRDELVGLFAQKLVARVLVEILASCGRENCSPYDLKTFAMKGFQAGSGYSLEILDGFDSPAANDVIYAHQEYRIGNTSKGNRIVNETYLAPMFDKLIAIDAGIGNGTVYQLF